MAFGNPSRRPPRPLDPARLEELALAYVARFATSAARLRGYLARKLRERGWDGPGDPQVERLVERFVQAGYVDDKAFAQARSGSLLRRGYGQRRVEQALTVAGISETVRDAVRANPLAERLAALAYVRKRRFGPYGTVPPDRTQRQRQFAAMLRAGHPLDIAREMIDATSPAQAEAWATSGEHE